MSYNQEWELKGQEMAHFLEAPDSLPSTSVVAYNNL